MKNIQINMKLFTIALISLVLAQGVLWSILPQSASASLKKEEGGALLVQVEAGQGQAGVGNDNPADFLIVVTDPETGLAVTGLPQSSFIVVNHFSVQGQTCGFSNNIATFNDVLNGAYHVQVGLPDIPGCSWVAGDYLAQVIVSTPTARGQGTATLSIR